MADLLSMKEFEKLDDFEKGDYIVEKQAELSHGKYVPPSEEKLSETAKYIKLIKESGGKITYEELEQL
ncbi:hypothetical protein QUW13_08270 [Enterococcus hirae]|nr:hypothetical protein [Enterococcus hirae]